MRRLLFSLVHIAFVSALFISFNVDAAFSDITKIYLESPTLDGLDICFGGGCAAMRHVSITSQEWGQVLDVFAKQKSEDISEASFERKQISEAIGMLETIVGAKIGTSGDLAGTFNSPKYVGQLDCNDEAINSTTYIHLMQHYGLIKLHESEDMRTRNFFFNGWPHSTAVIHEKETGERFAVDSWFYDNGHPATIVPFKLWKSGYIPTDSPIRK